MSAHEVGLATDQANPTDGAGAGEPGASVGCTAPLGATRYVSGSQTGQLIAGGRARAFVIHVPTGYDGARPTPLVLLLHGGLGTGAQMEGSSLMSPIADREGFVAVYPDGISRSWNAGGCCGPPADQDLDDVGFLAALLDHLQNQLCVDRQRIYATGMSNGAMMSHRLGCELSERIAAIAPVSGTDVTKGCNPKRAVPVMHTHGTADQHVPWLGGVGCGITSVPYPSVPASIAGWLGRNGCTATPPTPFVDEGNGHCARQGGCAPNADVILCTIEGGGHSWPGGLQKEDTLPACERAGEGPQSQTFHASEQIWGFFKSHRLSEKPP